MKNKTLTVFLVVILISFCFISNSAFASTPVSSLNDFELKSFTNTSDILSYANTLELLMVIKKKIII